MLGFLLARAGVPVTVFEKHKDFFRDFRGDTIHPSTLQLLYELGLRERFLTLPHSQVAALSAIIGGQRFSIADFSHLHSHAKFIALMPQWDFLNFLVTEVARFPHFTLLMDHEATGLIQHNGRTTRVHAKTPQGDVDIPATLIVGYPSTTTAYPSTYSGSGSHASPPIPKWPSVTSTTAASSSSSIATTISRSPKSSPKTPSPRSNRPASLPFSRASSASSPSSPAAPAKSTPGTRSSSSPSRSTA